MRSTQSNKVPLSERERRLGVNLPRRGFYWLRRHEGKDEKRLLEDVRKGESSNNN